MKYAVVKIGGSQYRVQEGDELKVDHVSVDPEKEIEFTDVLLMVSDGAVTVGQPTIEGLKVKAKVVSQLKGEKIRVARFKAKSRYKKVRGFRSFLTGIKIESIGGSTTAKTKKSSSAKPLDVREKIS